MKFLSTWMVRFEYFFRVWLRLKYPFFSVKIEFSEVLCFHMFQFPHSVKILGFLQDTCNRV